MADPYSEFQTPASTQGNNTSVSTADPYAEFRTMPTAPATPDSPSLYSRIGGRLKQNLNPLSVAQGISSGISDVKQRLQQPYVPGSGLKETWQTLKKTYSDPANAIGDALTSFILGQGGEPSPTPNRIPQPAPTQEVLPPAPPDPMQAAFRASEPPAQRIPAKYQAPIPGVNTPPSVGRIQALSASATAEGGGGHAGGGVASAEELSRPGQNYVVSKSGQLTYQGKAFALESTPRGGAHVTVLPSGEMRVNAGDLNPMMQSSLEKALAGPDPYASKYAPKMEAVQSTNVNKIGHDGNHMWVEYKSGQVYRYKDVPSSVFQSAKDADSVGSYIARNIKGKYDTSMKGTARQLTSTTK